MKDWYWKYSLDAGRSAELSIAGPISREELVDLRGLVEIALRAVERSIVELQPDPGGTQ